MKKETIHNSKERVADILNGNPYMYVSELRSLNSNKIYMNDRTNVYQFFLKIKAIVLIAELYFQNQFPDFVKALSAYLWQRNELNNFEADIYELKSTAFEVLKQMKEEKNAISFYKNLLTDKMNDDIAYYEYYISYLDKIIQYIGTNAWNIKEYLLIDITSLVDEEYRDINLEAIIHEINRRAQINFAIAVLFHLGIVKKINAEGRVQSENYNKYTTKISKWFTGTQPKTIEYLINIYHKMSTDVKLTEREQVDSLMYSVALDLIDRAKGREV